MSNSTFDRDETRNDQAGRRSQEIRRATVKAPTSSPLAEDRVFGRRAGFIGFSILAHLALLTGIMMNSNLIPALHQIGGGDGREQGTGLGATGNNSEISIIEVNDAGTPLTSAANTGVMTDATSEIALPAEVTKTESPPTKPVETKPVEEPKAVAQPKPKPVSKPAPQKPAPVVAAVPVENPTDNPTEAPTSASLQTEDQSELPLAAAPKLAQQPETPAEPPATAPTDEATTEDTSQQEAPPTLLATPPSETNSESNSESVNESANESVSEPVSEPNDEPQPMMAMAAAQGHEANEGGDSANSSSSAGSSQAEKSAGVGENGQGNGAGLVINGPIRDAGELRALPGNPNPVYPARDRLKRKEGTAVVLGQIQPDGRVGRVVLEKSSGSKEMDLESAKAFKGWRFQAGQAGWVRKPFQFRLVGNAKEVPAQLGEVLKRQSGALGK